MSSTQPLQPGGRSGLTVPTAAGAAVPGRGGRGAGRLQQPPRSSLGWGWLRGGLLCFLCCRWHKRVVMVFLQENK